MAIGSPFAGIITKFIVDPGGHPGGDSEFARYLVFPANEQIKASLPLRFSFICVHLLL